MFIGLAILFISTANAQDCTYADNFDRLKKSVFIGGQTK